MTVHAKIEQSKRWLERLENVGYNIDEATDYSSALIHCINSIPDHLLEYASTKFLFEIPMNSRNIKKSFEEKVSKTTNQNAKMFWLWFKSKLCFIQKVDEIGKIVWNIRNIDEHRITKTPTGIIAELGDMWSHVEFNSMGDADYFRSEFEPDSNIVIEYYLDELPEFPILDAGKHYLELMEQFVNDAETKFFK